MRTWHLGLEGMSACGKSSITDAIERELRTGDFGKILRIESGSIFRALAYLQREEQLLPDAVKDPEGFKRILRDIEDRISLDEEAKVMIDGLRVPEQALREVGKLTGELAYFESTQRSIMKILNGYIKKSRDKGYNIITEGRNQGEAYDEDPDMIMYIDLKLPLRVIYRTYQEFRKVLEKTAFASSIKEHSGALMADTELFWSIYEKVCNEIEGRDVNDSLRPYLAQYAWEKAEAIYRARGIKVVRLDNNRDLETTIRTGSLEVTNFLGKQFTRQLLAVAQR